MFMLGMLVTDGINGLYISHLINQADRIALIASRVMGLVVSGMSLTVAAFGVMKLASPSMDARSAGKELLIGGSVMATIASSFVLARWLARTQTLVPDAE